MFGLSRDFVQQDGISMLLAKAEGLPPEELNMVQARMLMNTAIPHHLRLLLREVDLQVTLEYSIPRRKMLSHLLKSDKLSMTEFFGLLLQIARGMEEGRMYMLRAEQYALHEDYIFIEGPLHSGKVYLTYIPLQTLPVTRRPGESLKSLIMVLISSINQLAGNGVQRLLQYCGEEEFTASGLKELLAELLTDESSVKRYQEERIYSIHSPGKNVPVEEEEMREQETTPPYAAHDQAAWMSGLPKLRLKQEIEQQPDVTTEDSVIEPPQSTAYKTYAVLGGLLADALLWKFLYLNHSETLGLVICVFVTLLIGILCWLVWTERILIGGSRGGAGEEREEPDNTRMNFRELEWDYGRNSRGSVPAQDTMKEQLRASSPVSSWNPVTPNMNETERRKYTRLEAPFSVAATTLLTKETNFDTGREMRNTLRAAPYLERVDDEGKGAPEKIELSRPNFIIGRSPEVAQYVEKSEGASRVHAEISRSQAGYILKDLDSRNGTLLEGEVMIPYKEYPLSEGTVFTIIKGCYTFHSA